MGTLPQAVVMSLAHNHLTNLFISVIEELLLSNLSSKSNSVVEDLSFTCTLKILFSFGQRKLQKSFAYRGIFRTKWNICDGVFFTSVKPYLKNVLNSIELRLSFVFYTTHPFVKNLTTLKTSGEKLFH